MNLECFEKKVLETLRVHPYYMTTKFFFFCRVEYASSLPEQFFFFFKKFGFERARQDTMLQEELLLPSLMRMEKEADNTKD